MKLIPRSFLDDAKCTEENYKKKEKKETLLEVYFK